MARPKKRQCRLRFLDWIGRGARLMVAITRSGPIRMGQHHGAAGSRGAGGRPITALPPHSPCYSLPSPKPRHRVRGRMYYCTKKNLSIAKTRHRRGACSWCVVEAIWPKPNTDLTPERQLMSRARSRRDHKIRRGREKGEFCTIAITPIIQSVERAHRHNRDKYEDDARKGVPGKAARTPEYGQKRGREKCATKGKAP